MKRILVLEDDDIQRRFIKESLESMEEEVEVVDADCLQTALYHTNTNEKFDLFLLDISIEDFRSQKGTSPNKKGLEFALNLSKKGAYFSVPIIFLSQFKDNIYEAINSIHCYSFLVKPFTKEELKKQVYGACFKKILYGIKDINGVIVKVNLDDIVYIRIKKGITTFRTLSGDIVSKSYTISNIEKGLPSWFDRCFRSVIINLKHVKGIKISDKTVSFSSIDDIVPCHRKYKLPEY